MTKRMEYTLLRALDAAGQILLDNLEAKKIIRKKGAVDLVTQVDHASENAILKIIAKDFPEHAILTEESPPIDGHEFKWVIDPLDGTINYAHGFPMSTVSIALEQSGEIVMGGVLDPFRNELFFAKQGEGATLNGKRIRVSKIKKLNDSLLCTGFPYDQREHPDEYLAYFRSFLIASQAIRRCGSAAMDLCYLACGRFDGFWEESLHPWDTAAAQLIVKEAGGQVSDFSGGPYSIYMAEIVASNGRVHREMLEVLKGVKSRDLTPKDFKSSKIV